MARSMATQAMTLEWVKWRRGPRTSQMPSSGSRQPSRRRPLASPVAGVTVVARPDQKARWDFPTVVRKYLSSQKEEQ